MWIRLRVFVSASVATLVSTTVQKHWIGHLIAPLCECEGVKGVCALG